MIRGGRAPVIAPRVPEVESMFIELGLLKFT